MSIPLPLAIARVAVIAKFVALAANTAPVTQPKAGTAEANEAQYHKYPLQLQQPKLQQKHLRLRNNPF